MSVISEQLETSISLVRLCNQAKFEARKLNEANELLREAIARLSVENERLRTQLLARDCMIDVLKSQQPALVRRQAE